MISSDQTIKSRQKFSLDEVRTFLRTTTDIRRCGDSLEEVERRNGKPVDTD